MPSTFEAVAALPPKAEPSKTFEGIPFLDDATRPQAPAIPGVTPAQRAQGRSLSLYHHYHLVELATVRGALNRLLVGTGTAEAVSDGVASLSMVANYSTFGNLCGRQCQLLKMHHDIEEGSMYPTLRRDPGLRPVLDRLSAEHRTVHALLELIQESSRAVAANPSREQILALGEIYAVFERVVVSHFGYEERELEDAIGYYDAL